MLSQLLMIFVIVSFDGCFLEGTVHTLDLAVGPGMIWFGQAIFRTVVQTDAIKDMQEGAPVFFAVGELDTIVCQDGVDFVGYGSDESVRELRRFHLAVPG